jgi:methionine-rich copper-binding protein CopC
MRVRHRSRGFLIILLPMVLMMAGVGTVTAANPPEFIASEPPSGAVVAPPPPQIVLTFSQPTDPSMTGGYVHNVDGIIVSTAIAVSPDDPTKVIVTLTPDLTSGWYMVMWNTALVGSDDYITGDLTFAIA